LCSINGWSACARFAEHLRHKNTSEGSHEHHIPSWGAVCRYAGLRLSVLPLLLLVSTTSPVFSEIRRAMLKTKA